MHARSSKLSAADRKQAILTAAAPVFARLGRDGATTKEIAKAAGVSEALLFKHFPNKQALYLAMQTSCCVQRDPAMLERMKAAEPSAQTLVELMRSFARRVVAKAEDDQETLQTRMMLRSLTEDGEFAGTFLKGIPTDVNKKLKECIRAAVGEGQAVDGKIRPDLAAWFAQHLFAMIKILLLPEETVLDMGVSRQKLADQVAWFALRGMGLKDETIQRYFGAKPAGE